MDKELAGILLENTCYREAYENFFELHKQKHHPTSEELAEFEKNMKRIF